MQEANNEFCNYTQEDILHYFFRAQEQQMEYDLFAIGKSREWLHKSTTQIYNFVRVTEYASRLEHLQKVCTPHVHLMYTSCTPMP